MTVAGDSITYTLWIEDREGLVGGDWTIEGDTTLPVDPWTAVVGGTHRDGVMTIEYYTPARGQCNLRGSVTSEVYVAHRWCEVGGMDADSIRLRYTNDWRGVVVAPEGSREGYDRDAFGSSSRYQKWEDEIIASLPTKVDSVFTPYTCTAFHIRDDGTAATDIDHVVALAEAYESGLDSARFREFAADTLNLTISVPAVNRHQKSDRDAAEWSPERNRGWFAAKVMAVKRKYSLTVDRAERDSLAVILTADTSRTVICP